MKALLHASLADNVYVYIMHSLPHQEAISLKEKSQLQQHTQPSVEANTNSMFESVTEKSTAAPSP